MDAITLAHDGKNWKVQSDPSVPHDKQLAALDKAGAEDRLMFIEIVGTAASVRFVDGSVKAKQAEWFANKAKESAKSGQVNAETADEAAKRKADTAKADAAKLAKQQRLMAEGNENRKAEIREEYASGQARKADQALAQAKETLAKAKK